MRRSPVWRARSRRSDRARRAIELRQVNFESTCSIVREAIVRSDFDQVNFESTCATQSYSERGGCERVSPSQLRILLRDAIVGEVVASAKGQPPKSHETQIIQPVLVAHSFRQGSVELPRVLQDLADFRVIRIRIVARIERALPHRALRLQLFIESCDLLRIRGLEIWPAPWHMPFDNW